jgi:hypothetical protein
VLAAEQGAVIEQSLWSAIRALRESAELDERIATRSATHGLEKAAAAHRNNAEEKRAQVAHLTAFAARRPPAAPPPT